MLSGVVPLVAQSNGALPVVSPSNLTTFTVEDGLLICTGDVYTSPEGRLYIATCGPDFSEDNTYLFEYDGSRTTKIPFHQVLGNPAAIPVFSGMDEQGVLYGRFHEDGELKGSLFRFHPESTDLQRFDLTDQIGEAGVVQEVHRDQEGAYWAYATDATHHYLLRWRTDATELVATIPKSEDRFVPDDDSFYRLLFRHGNKLWFWDMNGSPAWEYDIVSQAVRQLPPSYFGLPASTRGAHLTNMVQVGQDIFAVVSTADFLYQVFYQKFDPQAQRFVPLLEDFTFERSYHATRNALFVDAVGNVLIRRGDPYPNSQWVLIEQGTGKRYDFSEVFTSLQSQFPEARNTIKTIHGQDFRRGLTAVASGGVAIVEFKQTNALKTIPVTGARVMTQFAEDQVLIKVEKYGQWRNLSLNTGTLSPKDVGLEAVLSAEGDFHNLLDVEIDRDGHLWMPMTNYSRLLKCDPIAQRCERYEIGVPFLRFTFLDEERLALIQENGTLYYYNIRTQRLTPARYNEQSVRFSEAVLQLRQLADGFLWAATSNGLWKVNLETNETTKPYPGLPFQNGQVFCVEEVSGQEFWLGTEAQGVVIFNPQTGEYRSIDKSQGLSNNTVVAILKDNEGVRWANTFNGVNLISPSGEFLTKLYAEDGLANNEGNRFSSLKTSDGRLLLGTVIGATLIDPALVKQQLLSSDSLSIVLSELSYYDETQKQDTVLTDNMDQDFLLDLPADHRYLNLRVALSDFQKPSLNQFSYRLEWANGKEVSDWVFLDNESELSLTNLPAGKYDLVIQGKNFRGQASARPLRISIHAREFFYKQTWFYVLIFIILSALPIFWLIRERYERQRLQLLVQQRTRKIEQDKKVIEDYAEQLKSLDEAKSRFFTNISHEFRTPLTVISGMSEGIKGNENQRARGLIKRNTSHLLQLINQILDLRKLESGQLSTQYVQADVSKYLRYILESFHTFAHDKEVAIDFKTNQEALLLDFDPEKILRIASNLLSNALKFTPDGGTVSLELTSTTDTYTFLVRDTGVGISAEKLPRLFDRFYQVDGTSTRSGEGTGIGLTLVKELVELMGGTIAVQSEPDVGSTFTITLPITHRAPLEADVAANTNISATVPQSVNTPSILVENEGMADLPSLLLVEDNPDVMEYLTTCLEGTYRLSFAMDGQQGIDTALEIVPDIIISDVMMPHRDGFDLCNTLKTDERTSHIPIILLTAKADTDSRIAGLERGADAYLAKPFDRRELNVQLKNLLAIRQRLQARYASLESLAPSADRALQQEDSFVLKIRQLVLEHMAEEGFGVPELCRRAAMSRTQLHNKIKSLTNKSTSKFIRSIRIDKAAELLLKSDLNVSQVALEVGFDSLTYFSRIFAEETGFRPNKYREIKALEQ